MKKPLHEIVRRTRGRDNDPDTRAVGEGVFIDARKVDGNDALFGEAANDADGRMAA